MGGDRFSSLRVVRSGGGSCNFKRRGIASVYAFFSHRPAAPLRVFSAVRLLDRRARIALCCATTTKYLADALCTYVYNNKRMNGDQPKNLCIFFSSLPICSTRGFVFVSKFAIVETENEFFFLDSF